MVRLDQLMPQEFLQACHPTAGIEQLCGAGVPQPVEMHCDPNPLARRLEPGTNHVLLEWLITIEKDVARRSLTAHRQVLTKVPHGRIRQVHRAVVLALAEPESQPPARHMETVSRRHSAGLPRTAKARR